MNVSTYNIILDGHIIFTGTGGEVQKQFGLSANTRVSEYALYGKKINKKYDVKYAEKGDLRVEYDFYENGEWVFRGTNKEFKDRFNVQFTGSVASYARNNSLILGRFRAYLVTEKEQKNKFEKKINTMIQQLKITGDTISDNDPEIYMEILKEKGFPCTYRRTFMLNGGKKDYYYVLERV